MAGQRVALNLTGLKKGDIKKGAVLARENSFENTKLLDAKVRILPSSQRTVKKQRETAFSDRYHRIALSYYSSGQRGA